MRLLFMYIEEVGILKGTQMNFTDRYKFQYDHEKKILHWEKNQNALPDNFFSFYKNGYSVVESVSAIIGNNGAGKTTIAKTFLQKALREESPTLFVFEVKGKFCLQHSFSGKIENDIILEPACKNALETRQPFPKFVYCSNFYSPQHNLEDYEGNGFIDLSTSWLLKKDFDRFYNTGFVEQGVKIDKIAAHDFAELIRNANFFAEWQTKTRDKNNENKYSSGFEIPIPLGVVIELVTNDVDFLISQISQKRKDPKDTTVTISGNDKLHNCILSLFELLENTNSQKFNDFHTYHSFLCRLIRVQIGNWLRTLLTDYSDIKINLYGILNKLQQAFSTAKSEADFFLCYEKFLQENKTLEISQNGDIGSLDNKEFIATAKVFQLCKESILGKAFQDYLYLKFDATQGENELALFIQICSSYFQSKFITDYLSFKWTPPLSSGELAQLNLYSRLYDKMGSGSGDADDSFVIFLDEIEITVHPDVQRDLVSNLIQFCEQYFDGYKIHLIFASHSPVLLSDIPKSNVVFLERDEDSTKVESKEINTFASNIHALYRDSFSADGTMGTFAESKIQEVLKYIHGEESCFTDRKDVEQCIELIGESVIKNKLKSLLEEHELPETKEMIDEKIRRKQQELDELLKKKETI